MEEDTYALAYHYDKDVWDAISWISEGRATLVHPDQDVNHGELSCMIMHACIHYESFEIWTGPP